MPQENKSSEQIQYENLTGYFRTLVWITGIVLGIICTVAMVLSYKDREAMNKSLTATSDKIQKNIDDLNALSQTKIKATSDYAQKEIDIVGQQTKSFVNEKVNRELDYLFSSDKIQGYIRDKAVKVAKTQIADIVSETVDPEFKETEKEMNLIALISEAAIRLRIGIYDGYLTLKDYIDRPKTIKSKMLAINLLKKIETDYIKSDSINVENLYGYYKNLNKDTLTQEQYLARNNLINVISDNTASIELKVRSIMILNKMYDLNVGIFDFEAMKLWYEQKIQKSK